MVLSPEARTWVEQSRGEQPVFDPAYDVAAAREANRAAAAAEAVVELPEVRDLDATAGGRTVRVRIFRPADAEPGVVVHLHGGGFVFHDVEVHDPVCRRLAVATRRAVVSVDYRLAPEHPFPAAPDDVDTALAWLAAEGAELGLDGPLAVHGDSAGGNLAVVAALRHPGLFSCVVAHYPFLDPTAGFPSYDLGAESAFDPREAAWYWDQYAPSAEARTDPDVAPLLSDRLGTLPPTLVTTVEHDPLRDEGERLAELVSEQGGSAVAVRYLGQVHGYWRHEVFPAAPLAMAQAAAFVRSHG